VASYTTYEVPPILTSISPSPASPHTNVSIFGLNFADCGGSLLVRIQSASSFQYIPAWFNTSSQIIFPTDRHTISGIISVSLDGQHFDSLTASPLLLTMGNGGSSSDSDSFGSSSSDQFSPSNANWTWLYILLGVVAIVAASFLAYVIYRYKVKDDYSRLYDL